MNNFILYSPFFITDGLDVSFFDIINNRHPGSPGSNNEIIQINPIDLFEIGDEGFFFDSNQLNSLFIDTGGAVQATSSNNSIAYITDLSGKGNHLIQSNSSKRSSLGRHSRSGKRNFLIETNSLNEFTGDVSSRTHSGITLTQDPDTIDGFFTFSYRMFSFTNWPKGKDIGARTAYARIENINSRYVTLGTQPDSVLFAIFDLQEKVVVSTFNGFAGDAADAWGYSFNDPIPSEIFNTSISEISPGVFDISITYRLPTDFTADNYVIGVLPDDIDPSNVFSEQTWVDNFGWFPEVTYTSTKQINILRRQLVIGSDVGEYQLVSDDRGFDVTQEGEEDLWYLYFNGGSMTYSTPEMNMNSDKITIIAKILRERVNPVFDPSVGNQPLETILELSSDWTLNTGSFVFVTGDGNNNSPAEKYSSASRGSSVANTQQYTVSSDGFSAYSMHTIAITHDIEAPLSTISVNNIEGSNSSFDKGAGNFGTYKTYIGNRNEVGSNTGFNGHIYKLLVINKILTNEQINSVIAWIDNN